MDVTELFAGWEETMLLSCFQGHMGSLAADDLAYPTAGRVTVGDFCFFAGRPNAALVETAGAPTLVPRTADWHPVIEAVWGERVRPHTRYATRKDPSTFDRGRLTRLARGKP